MQVVIDFVESSMAKSKQKSITDECLKSMLPIRDALDVINGKWKILILISVMHGNKRFRDIERSIPRITSKMLAKELKDLEQHTLIKRSVYDDYPVAIEYTVTEYAKTLEKVMKELHSWGINHRKKIIGK
jgi:DNA-binding HxlR family transcriptional regulator